ncbi:MAG: FecR family protein [Bacteroidales bacterium]
MITKDILYKFFQGLTNLHEESQIRQWIESSPANRKEYEEERKLHDMILLLKDEDSFIQSGVIPFYKKLWFRRAMQSAAMVVAMVGSALGYQGYKDSLNGKQQRNNLYTFSVDHGQKASIVLPDGTEVWLNSKTKLRYDGTYNKEDRILYLEGEAFFDVAKDKEKKFVVKTNDLDVVALGTSFNVKANGNDDYVAVTLIEGKVQVESENQHNTLIPNQHLVYNKMNKTCDKSKLHNSSHAALWRNGQLAFHDETLENIGKSMSRMYDVDIEWGSESIRNIRFSGVIRNSSLKNILQVICVSAPIKYQIKNNTIRFEEFN